MNTRLMLLLCLYALLTTLPCSDAFAARLDASFGNDGRVALELGLGTRANAVVVQPDGKVVAAGFSSTADRDFMLFRLLKDGSPDSDFNFDGTVSTPVGSFDDEVLALALQDDGKIIAAGYSSNESNRDFALVRYNSDGSLDRNFGLEGIVVTAVGSNNEEITDITVQPDGGIIFTGSAQTSGGKVVVLGRYLADGTPDTTFANNGFSLNAVGVNAQAESIALSDNRIIVSGSYSDSVRTGLMVLGFDNNGLLDANFAGNGIAVPADTKVFSEGYGMFVREDGTILVAGSVGEEGKRDAALFQFTAAGYPDSAFEDKGVLITQASEQDDVLYDVVITGEMTAATGFKTVEEGREFLLITYEKSRGAVLEDTGGTLLAMSAEEDGNTADPLATNVVTTEFGTLATALAADAASSSSVLVVGESNTDGTSSAAVSKYTTAGFVTTTSSGTDTSGGTVQTTGYPYILTGQPLNVTRTTADILATIFEGLGSSVTQRGIVFSILPFPTLNDFDDTADDESDDDGTDDEEGDEEDKSDDTEGPSIIEDTDSDFDTDDSIILSVITDENATCKYNKDSDVEYDSMSGSFEESDSLSHSVGLGSLSTGDYTYYVRCEDAAGNQNTSGTPISFTVTSSGGGGDDNTAAPDRLELSPDGTVSSTSVTLSLTTDVDATCKYTDSGSGMDYSQMRMDFDTTGRTSHSEPVSGLEDGKTYTYYVRCKNTASGVENTTDEKISFTVEDDTTAPTITNETPSSFKSGDLVTLSITTDEPAECRYNEIIDDTDYDSMTEYFISTNDDDTDHGDIIGVNLADGSHTYYARCKDKSKDENKTADGTEITFTVNPIVQFSPSIIPFYSVDRNNIIRTGLQTVGSFFVGTAIAQEDDDDTTTTTTTNTDDDTDDEDFLEEGSTDNGSGTGSFNTRLKNLKPGTFFYARAYAVTDGKVYYGNQVGFQTADSCFVATAAFGSIFHPSVQILRDFRDQFMHGNPVGRSLVSLYYRYSPAVADVISSNNGLRFTTRALLLPIIGSAWLAMHISGLLWLLAASILLFCWYGVRSTGRDDAAGRYRS